MHTVTVHVAPPVGAWIEIIDGPIIHYGLPSLPLWERGLKFENMYSTGKGKGVAPPVGAWIEINHM